MELKWPTFTVSFPNSSECEVLATTEPRDDDDTLFPRRPFRQILFYCDFLHWSPSYLHLSNKFTHMVASEQFFSIPRQFQLSSGHSAAEIAMNKTQIVWQSPHKLFPPFVREIIHDSGGNDDDGTTLQQRDIFPTRTIHQKLASFRCSREPFYILQWPRIAMRRFNDKLEAKTRRKHEKEVKFLWRYPTRWRSWTNNDFLAIRHTHSHGCNETLLPNFIKTASWRFSWRPCLNSMNLWWILVGDGTWFVLVVLILDSLKAGSCHRVMI